MFLIRSALFWLLFILYNATQIQSKFEFTNIECTAKDKEFVEFEYCYIKSVNRSYKYISVKARLLQKPLNNVVASLNILRRFQGYTPITMNVTFDICKYMSGKKNSLNPMLRLFEEITQTYTNVNHKCPYNHDFEIEKLPTQREGSTISTRGLCIL